MFSALLVTAGLAGCGTDQTAAPSTSTEQALADTSYSTGLKAQDGFTRVAQTDALELFINGKTAELCVREKASDRRWYSTPQEGEGRQALLAQIELRYANSKSQISTMNSYTDAVELGQFVWEACEGGVRVVYDIGKRKKVYTMPTVITKTRFEQVLLAGLSETDRTTVRGFYTAYSLSSASSQVVREELISKYPRIQDDDVYVLMDGLADFAAARLEAVIVSGGYTQEELEKDNAENQVDAPEASITFRVPVEYTLDKDGFVARVVTEDIQCPSSAHLLTLSLLPYFGAAGEKEEGYMLVPDGSGALIRLNNGKASQGLYQAGLYGDNLTAGRSDVLTEKQAVPLPVYGMRRQTAGFLAIIESGDALAAVNAAVSGGANRFNYVYPSFTLNQAEAADVPYYMATSMYFYQKTMTREDLQVRYCFLNGEGSTYSGMARRYQQYLLDAGTLRLRPEAKPALYLSLLGAIDYEDDIVGIPVQKTVALTTFDQARGIVEQLREQGVDSVAVLYEGWANGGLRHSAMDSLKVQKQLGGSKGMAAFEEYMQQNGGRVYWDIDLQYVHRNGLFDGYKAMSDAPKSIMGKTAGADVFHLVTGRKTGTVNLLSPGKYLAFAERSLQSLSKLPGRGVSLSGLGSTLYADFSESAFVNRQQAARNASEVFRRFSDAGRVLGNRPSAYALAGLEEVVNLPADSNGHYLLDEEIPFYQMVLHGCLPYAGEPVNYANNTAEAALKLIETGAMPGFEWMYQPNYVLHDVDSTYVAVSYREWLDEAVSLYKKVAGALSGVTGQRIVSHAEAAPDVYRTGYEDGTAIYTNYGSAPVTVGGVTVAAKDYAAVKEGAHP